MDGVFSRRAKGGGGGGEERRGGGGVKNVKRGIHVLKHADAMSYREKFVRKLHIWGGEV